MRCRCHGILARIGLLTITANVMAVLPIAAEPPSPASAAASERIPAIALADLPARVTEPQAAVSENGDVYLAFGADEALYCTISREGGRGYAMPVKVAEAGSLSLGTRSGPRIAVVGKTVVISVVYGAQGKGNDGDLLARWKVMDCLLRLADR